MSHPLETRIGALRARLRGWIAVYGLGCWLACAVGAVVVYGLADYVVRFRDPGIRVLATLAVFVVTAWAAYRYLYLPWTVRLRDVDLARRLQRRFPSLGDDLASAVEFLKQAEDDPTAGSASLRRAVVARALDAAEGLDFGRVVQPRAALLTGLMAGGVGLLAGLLAIVDPTSARIAVSRLVRPLAEIRWPQVHHLAVRNPVQRIARGQPFEAEVIDAGGVRLPVEVRILYRFENADGTVSEESERMHLVRGMMVARRERVTRPFSFRVEGGDDRSMPWQPVEVVDPPAIASLRATLTPPAYTGWPPEQSEGNLRALAGTRVQIAATSNKPLAAAMLVVNGRTRAARLAGDGRRLTVPAASGSPWVLDRSGSYGFRLTDREGITDGEDARWEIRVLPDAPPVVTLDASGAGEALFVTPRAVVPLVVTASDDLAVRRIELRFSRSDPPNEPPARRALYVGPARPKSSGGPASVLRDGTDQTDRHTIRYAWKLDELKLAAGAQVTFWAEAADYKPQTAKSAPRRLSVVTPEDLTQRLASREAGILADLSRALQLERRGREQVTAIQKRAAESSRLTQLDVDQLRGAELNQRQIHEMLSSRSDGTPSQILGLLADLADNKLDPPRVRQRMETLLARLEQLAANELPAAGRELTASIKEAQTSLDEPGAKHSIASVERPMAAAGKHQDAIIAALEQMTGELSQWDLFRSFPRDVSQLARQQEDLASRTGDIARRTLTKQLKDLTPQEAAELAEAARRQAAIAGRFDAIQQAMEEAVGRTPPGEAAAANAADALRRARELDLAGDMRSASERIHENQLGQATQKQGRIQEGLRDVLDRLSGRASREPGQARSEGDQSLEKIRQRQVELNRRTGEFEKTLRRTDKAGPEARRRYEALSGEQEQLADALRKMSGPNPDIVPGERKPAGPRAKRAPAPSVPPPVASKDGAADAIDRELFAPDPKNAPPATTTAEPKGPATPAAIREQMLRAASRIRAADTGPTTQQLQRRIVAQLEELLRRAGQAPGDSASQSAQAGGPKARADAKRRAEANAKGAQAKSGAQPGQAPSGGKVSQGVASGPGGKMSLMRRVWGDLPEREREKILQLQPPEEFLPQYEVEIEAYFRQLAEGRAERGEGRREKGEGNSR